MGVQWGRIKPQLWQNLDFLLFIYNRWIRENLLIVYVSLEKRAH